MTPLRMLNRGLWLSLSILCSACSLNYSGPDVAHSDAAGGKDNRIRLGSFGEPDQINRSTRSSASVESGIGLAAKTLLVDPIIRPVSTLKALYGVTLKSAGGFLERSFINRLRFPRLEKKPIPALARQAPMDLQAWEAELDALTGTTVASGRIHLLIDGEAYFKRLEQSLLDAESSIDIRSYIFDNDDVALHMAKILRNKSEAVKFKILVDGLADIFASRLDSSSMPDNSELPASISDYLTFQSPVEFRKQSNPWFTGDHVKLTIVDTQHAFLGGMNIGREYRYDWHDLMMEIEGPIVQQLQYEFDQAWAKSSMLGDLAWLARAYQGYQLSEASVDAYPIRLLRTTIHDSELYRAQVKAIQRSRSYIYIENPYFSDDKILFELARARRRGVDVRVILSSSNDNGLLALSNQKTINRMLGNGIRVYLYPGMTHVKAAVYDGWACLGSANFDKLSLQINQELNLGFSDAETVTQLLEQVFYPDFARSTEIKQPLPLGTRHHIAELIADELL